jgi:phage-related protein
MASTIKIAILANSAAARRELDQFNAKLKHSESSTNLFGLSINKTMKGVAKGIAGAVAATAALAIAAGPKLLDIATKVEAMGNKARIVFGGSLPMVRKWADTVSQKMGLTSLEAQNMAASIGDILVPMGFARVEAAKLSTQATSLSGALAQWSGGTKTTTDAQEALSDALTGEFERLKEFGVLLDADRVKSLMMAAGKDKLTGAARAQAQAEIVLKEITRQSAGAVTAYEQNTNKLALAKNKLTSQVNTLKERLATALIPAMSAVMTWAGTKLGPALLKLGQWIGANVVPRLRELWSWFQEKVLPAVRSVASSVMGALQSAFNTIRNKINENRPQLIALANALRSVANFVLQYVAPVLGKLAAIYLKNLARQIGTTITIIGGFVRAIQAIVSWVNNAIGAVDRLVSRITGPLQKAIGAIGNIGSVLGHIPGFAGGVTNFAGGLAVVGERGPEIVNLPRGSDVIPAGQSAAMLGGSDVTVTLVGGDPLMQALLSIVDARVTSHGRSTTAAARAGTGKARVR